MQAGVQEILAPKPYRLDVKTIGKRFHQEPVISGRDTLQHKTSLLGRRLRGSSAQPRNIVSQPYSELCQVRMIFRFCSAVDYEMTGNVVPRHDGYDNILQIRVPHLDGNTSAHFAGLCNQEVL